MPSPQRSKTESMNAPSARRLAGRPREGAVEQVEDAAEDDEDAGEDPGLGGRDDRGDDRDPEADQRQRVRGQAEPAEREGDRRRDAADAGARSRADDERSRGGLLAAGGAGEAEDGGLAARRTPSKASGRRRQTVSRPTRRVVDEARGAEPAEVPRDERLRQADLLDELGDASPRPRRGAGRSAAGSRRRGPCGRGAARAARRAGRRRTRSSSGCGRGVGLRGVLRGSGTVASTTVYINRG